MLFAYLPICFGKFLYSWVMDVVWGYIYLSDMADRHFCVFLNN